MTKEEKIILEQSLSFVLIPYEEGMRLLNLILNTRDYSNPLYKPDTFIKNHLLTMHMKKETSDVYFSLSSSLEDNGGYENRSITGTIHEKDGETLITMDVFRHSDAHIKEYNVVELFKQNKDGSYKLFTSYKDESGIKTFLSRKKKLSDKYLKDFISEKINPKVNKL